MEQLINIVFSVLLVTTCASGVMTVAIVLSRLFDGIVGVVPTDKEVEEMTK